MTVFCIFKCFKVPLLLSATGSVTLWNWSGGFALEDWMHGALSRSPLACFDSEVLFTVQDFRMFFVVLGEGFFSRRRVVRGCDIGDGVK